MTDSPREYAVQEGSDDPQVLAAALNSMAVNGYRLDFIYDRFDRLPLLVYSRAVFSATSAVDGDGHVHVHCGAMPSLRSVGAGAAGVLHLWSPGTVARPEREGCADGLLPHRRAEGHALPMQSLH
jgi:hypothetical protein